MARIFFHSLAILVMSALFASASRGETVKVEAVPGIPFGVGRVVIPVESYIDAEKLDTHYMSVTDAEGRLRYPALRYTQPLGLVRELLGIPTTDTPSQLHVHFLFTGSEPLHLQLNLPELRTVTVIPAGRRPAYNRLMRSWWSRYKSAARKQRLEGDYSPIVETYLTNMLSRRMGLANETLRTSDSGESLSMLLGTEKIRLAMLQESTYGRVNRNEPLTEPVPPEIQWPEVSPQKLSPQKLPPPATANGGVQKPKAQDGIEEIARYVPQECFYIRFSQFPNYLWLRRLLEEYGGDLSRMVMLRGTDSQLNKRVENQLGLRESALSAALGPRVISDVAMIGRDTYLREGAAIGILFEAKSNLLKNELMGQRKKRVKELTEAGATINDIKIGDTNVSFATTPDHQLRSFYVQQGKYHLVTNCRSIAERFIACHQDKTSLGDSEEFRYARSLIPLGEENTLFVYLSRRFFQGLLSPQYQIELPRRLRSVTDNELMELATLAAVGEGHGGEPITMDRLVEWGFLASRVDARPDGSFTKVVNGRTIDSVRGARGTFLPIPDTPIEGITRTEANRFQRTADFHRRSWRQMDPVLIGLRRTAVDDETERVEIQARMLPLNKEKYGFYTDIFGPPTTTRIRPLADDIVSVQGFVDGGKLGIAPHHLYFGIRDAAPKIDYSERRFLKSLQVLRTAPAYVAAWPRPGFLDSIGLGGRPIGEGYRKMLLGLFRLDALNGFSLLSFDQHILSEVAPALGVEEVATPAQVHVRVGDVKNSNFGKWANDLDFQRAWETSVGNVHLLHVMTQQLRVPMSQAKEAAERALHAELHCPLGGEYSLHENPDGTRRWASSAWVDGKQKRRDEYVSPLMNWLRGFQAAVTISDDRIVATGSLDIQRAKGTDKGGIKLPLFNFFSGSKKKKTEPVPADADVKTNTGEAVGATGNGATELLPSPGETPTGGEPTEIRPPVAGTDDDPPPEPAPNP